METKLLEWRLELLSLLFSKRLGAEIWESSLRKELLGLLPALEERDSLLPNKLGAEAVKSFFLGPSNNAEAEAAKSSLFRGSP